MMAFILMYDLLDLVVKGLKKLTVRLIYLVFALLRLANSRFPYFAPAKQPFLASFKLTPQSHLLTFLPARKPSFPKSRSLYFHSDHLVTVPGATLKESSILHLIQA